MKLLTDRLPNSAVAKHLYGRHEPIIYVEEPKISKSEEEAVKVIFKMQGCEVMECIKNYNVEVQAECCQNIINSFVGNYQEICFDTKSSFLNWHREREFRITGSVCYSVYTYTKNKTADWNKKCDSVFSTKEFKTVYTEYGKKNERNDRKVFIDKTKQKVIETGLIVSELNPWLAYSPDGVIFDSEKPVSLLEVKCPFVGKTEGIKSTIASLLSKNTYLGQNGSEYFLKKKHQYYGQVQLGMAVLNLELTHFVIYSLFENDIFIINVKRDDAFLKEMLFAIKKVFYSVMVHNVCLRKENSNKENEAENQNI